MARVRSMRVADDPVRRDPTEVDCEFATVNDGEAILISLRTFGSDKRMSGPKVSQSMQFDREHALRLAELITRTFSGSA